MSETNPRISRVCIVTSSPYPGERRCVREAETLIQDGYDVDVICTRRPGGAGGVRETQTEVISGVSVHRLSAPGTIAARGGFVRYAFHHKVFFAKVALKLTGLWLRQRFDVIQVDGRPDGLVFSTLLPRIFGTRVVFRLLEPASAAIALRPARWFLRRLERVAIVYSSRTIAAHREIREACGRRGANVNRISVVLDVPDDPRLQPEYYDRLASSIAATRKEERRSGEFRVLYRGPIDAAAGVDLLVRALPRLLEDVPGVRLRLIGAGDGVDDLLALAGELGVTDRVQYLGDVDDFDTVAEEILTADVAALPMRRSLLSSATMPFGMLETVMLGCVVVASRLAGATSYFPDDTIFYFEPGDEDDLAGKLHYVFAHPEEMAERATAAARVLETYHWERERKKYLGVYQSLLGVKPR